MSPRLWAVFSTSPCFSWRTLLKQACSGWREFALWLCVGLIELLISLQCHISGIILAPGFSCSALMAYVGINNYYGIANCYYFVILSTWELYELHLLVWVYLKFPWVWVTPGTNRASLVTFGVKVAVETRVFSALSRSFLSFLACGCWARNQVLCRCSHRSLQWVCRFSPGCNVDAFLFGENNVVVLSLKAMMVTPFPLQNPLSAVCSRGLAYPSRASAVFEEHCLLGLGSFAMRVVPA